jgi:hypothetical protein
MGPEAGRPIRRPILWHQSAGTPSPRYWLRVRTKPGRRSPRKSGGRLSFRSALAQAGPYPGEAKHRRSCRRRYAGLKHAQTGEEDKARTAAESEPRPGLVRPRRVRSQLPGRGSRTSSRAPSSNSAARSDRRAARDYHSRGDGEPTESTAAASCSGENRTPYLYGGEAPFRALGIADNLRSNRVDSPHRTRGATTAPACGNSARLRATRCYETLRVFFTKLRQ